MPSGEVRMIPDPPTAMIWLPVHVIEAMYGAAVELFLFQVMASGEVKTSPNGSKATS